eukprot:TRINITY_DN5227_c0_g1_i1.p2 TRINITY_DN5227_c0_g1~~TRINITY_DN5227_c0_g1_i1.p2  ORF type:complete len:260 (+),score=70.76 TRINITY_DN5227_c0_g1_i1:47-826(+)
MAPILSPWRLLALFAVCARPALSACGDSESRATSVDASGHVLDDLSCGPDKEDDDNELPYGVAPDIDANIASDGDGAEAATFISRAAAFTVSRSAADLAAEQKEGKFDAAAQFRALHGLHMQDGNETDEDDDDHDDKTKETKGLPPPTTALTEIQLAEIVLGDLDKDGDRRISFSEFMDSFNTDDAPMDLTMRDKVSRMFWTADTSENGLLGIDEVPALVVSMREGDRETTCEWLKDSAQTELHRHELEEECIRFTGDR